MSIVRNIDACDLRFTKQQQIDDDTRLLFFAGPRSLPTGSFIGKLLYVYAQNQNMQFPVDCICEIGRFLSCDSFRYLPRYGFNLKVSWNMSDECFSVVSPYNVFYAKTAPVDFTKYRFELNGGLNKRFLNMKFYATIADVLAQRSVFILTISIFPHTNNQNETCDTLRDFVKDCNSFEAFKAKFMILNSISDDSYDAAMNFAILDPRHNFWNMRQIWGIIYTLKNGLHPE